MRLNVVYKGYKTHLIFRQTKPNNDRASPFTSSTHGTILSKNKALKLHNIPIINLHTNIDDLCVAVIMPACEAMIAGSIPAWGEY